MICHPDEVVSFDSTGNAQIDMIFPLDELVSVDSIHGNQNDFFLSLFFFSIKTMISLTFHFEIRVCLMFSNVS